MVRVAPTIIGLPSVSVPRGGSTTADSIDFKVPPGAVDGDVLIVAATNHQAAGVVPDMTSPGFTRVGLTYPTSGQGRVTGFWARVVEGSVPSTIRFQSDTGYYRYAGVMILVRGVDLSSMLSGYSNSYTGVPSGAGAETVPYQVDGPSLALFLGANESTANNAITPTLTPPGFDTLGLVASSDIATGTRTTLWLGSRAFEDSTVPGLRMEWPSVSGPRVQSIALRGADQNAPPVLDFVLLPRRGTQAQIEASTVILRNGELGVNLTTRQLLLGDGVTSAKNLPAVSGGVLIVPDINSIPPGTPAGTLIFEEG